MQKSVYEYISKKNNDPIVERKTCKRTGEKFAIFAGDKELLKAIAPKFGAKVFNFPSPNIGSTARMIKRMMFRNERGLYNTTSMISGTSIPSMYHPSTGIKSVSAEEWENIDMEKYGQEYDFNRFFMEQFKELYSKTPKVGLVVFSNENGKYDNYSSNNKNTYLNSDIMHSENVSYSTTIKQVKNGYDLLQVNNSELVYDCLCSSNLTKCYNVWYSSNCYDCGFCITCKNCTNCWFCDNLENKQNHIFNKPASKEEIQALKDKMKSYSGFQNLQAIFEEKLWDIAVRPATRVINSENTIGSTIYNSQNALLCFDSYDIQDCRYCTVAEYNTNCMDTTIFNRNSTGVYQAAGGGFLTKSHSCITGWESSNIYFCDFCISCEYMIGCCGMKNKKYCILNKQYTKNERLELTEKIFSKLMEEGIRGEFFPSHISPFPYNDTVAMDYFPVKQVIDQNAKTLQETNPNGFGVVTILNTEDFISDAILDLGGEEKISIKWRTRNHKINIPSNMEIVLAKDLSDHIDDIDDSICSKIIICEQSGRPFRISKLELDFYRKMGFAVPRLHHDLRHQRRTGMRPPRLLYYRTSDKTGVETVSNYPQNAPFKVYTQKEYEKIIY